MKNCHAANVPDKLFTMGADFLMRLSENRTVLLRT